MPETPAADLTPLERAFHAEVERRLPTDVVAAIPWPTIPARCLLEALVDYATCKARRGSQCEVTAIAAIVRCFIQSGDDRGARPTG